MQQEQITIASLDQLQEFAIAFSSKLMLGMTLGLSGPLGAGKTTLASALIKALGCNQPVTSPSFVLEQRYPIPGGEIAHWDLYRLTALPQELLLPSRNILRIVEWSERFAEIRTELNLELIIKPDATYSKRVITVIRY